MLIINNTLLFRTENSINSLSDSQLLISHFSHLTAHFSHLTPHLSHLTPYFSHLTPHFSHLTAHFSHLTPHFSHLTPHFSHLTPHFSHLTAHFSRLPITDDEIDAIGDTGCCSTSGDTYDSVDSRDQCVSVGGSGQPKKGMRVKEIFNKVIWNFANSTLKLPLLVLL